jgi:hypothetical protein
MTCTEWHVRLYSGTISTVCCVHRPAFASAVAQVRVSHTI